jgi:hypothetical protein
MNAVQLTATAALNIPKTTMTTIISTSENPASGALAGRVFGVGGRFFIMASGISG